MRMRNALCNIIAELSSFFMITLCKTLYDKNDLRSSIYKIQLNTDVKIILLNYSNNYGGDIRAR